MVVSVLLGTVGSSRLQAQTSESGTITGAVLDVTGKPIPGAVVVIRNESAGQARNLASDPSGKFSVSGLPAGTYTLEASAPSFASSRRTGIKLAANGSENVSISLDIGEIAQSITVEGAVSVAAETAPSQNTLDARSARSEISPEYIQNFESPIADYTELLNNAPGTWSVNPNGVGLGDSKTYFRGFKDGQYTMQADGIPFNDTNDPTHHSWAFFPSEFIHGVDFDRSPGTASSIGPTNFGGTVNLLSRSVAYSPDIRATASYGSFNTRLLALDADSGQFGPGNKSSLTMDLHQMLSDGYQTYNYQKRVAGFLKYQYRVNDRTTITVFGGLVDLWTNTPNLKGPSRAQIAQFGDNYLLSNDPSQPNYYGYNFYHVQTDFEYIGVHSELGRGWKFDNKLYTYRYWNKQNYNNPKIQSDGFFLPGAQSVTTTSAVDKLNGYRKVGDVASVSYEMARGVFRAGLWFEWAYTDRYQIPSDPRTWQNSFLANFHEHFTTLSAQPFVEYEYNIARNLSALAGVKVAQYGMYLTQFQDNGNTGVGCIGGVLSTPKVTQTTVCIGGPPSTYHEAHYRSWMPAASLRYKLKTNWTAYAQFATGSNIPPSAVFDFGANGANVNGASGSAQILQVGVLPRPTSVKTYQVGSVTKFNRWTLDVDAYYSHFQNPYSAFIDAATGESYFYQTGPSNTKGIEAESNVLIGFGFSLYLNGTLGSAKYQEGSSYANGGLWVANTPKNTEAIGLTYQRKNWDIGMFNKRVGTMYNDNGTLNQAVTIDPFNVTNLFFNYTVKNERWLRGTKIRFGINNLLNQHNIVAVVPFSSKSNAPSPGDQVTLLPARDFSITMTFGYAPAQ
ncbi:MAG: TonB-dependent receptor [Acidobacteriia bacterium]|nr:TonB-dependent receptor [Terriglobia bacterium]